MKPEQGYWVHKTTGGAVLTAEAVAIRLPQENNACGRENARSQDTT